MFQILRQGIDISRHHVKGVYVCMIGKNRKQSPNSMAEVICTLREGQQDASLDCEACAETGAKHGPITLSHQGTHVTLRPWDPHACVIAAAIRNRLIHFPIRPGSGVLGLGCSLKTLSHIADIIGPEGRLIGIIDKTHGQCPSSEELRKFFKSHPGVFVITEDVQSATLERYELLLTLPTSSKFAFLMGLHPRLGESSPVRKLAEDEAAGRQIVRRIFGFLEGGEAPDVRSLVVCHWPAGTRVDVIRNVVLSHIDILQRWRASRKVEAPDKAADSDSADGEDTTEKDTEEKTTSATDTQGESTKKRSHHSPEDQEFVPLWVFLHLPTDHIVINNPNANVNNKLIEVVDDMKRLTSGLRTGLLAKEQLLLTPYFPNHALLLLKYVAHRDECSKKVAKKKFPSPPGLDAAGGAASTAAHSGEEQPPATGAVPVPCFAPRFKAEPPGSGSGLAGMAPATVAMSAPAVGSCGGGAAAAAASSQVQQRAARRAAAAGHERPLTWLDAQAQAAEQPPLEIRGVGGGGGGGGGAFGFGFGAADALPMPMAPGDRSAASDFGGLCGGPPPMLSAGMQGLGPLVGPAGSSQLGGQGMMMPRAKGQNPLDGPRGGGGGGGGPGLPGGPAGRHLLPHAGTPGPVTPGPLEHFAGGGGLGGMDVGPGPCLGADRSQIWGQQLPAPGHMAPPGLWGEGYPPDPPMPVGPPGARGGWRPPNYGLYGGGAGGAGGGKGGGGAPGPGAPGPAGPGKGLGNMMGAWRGAVPPPGQGGGGGGGPPHYDPNLQYAMMSF